MIKQTTASSILIKVVQIIETDSVEAANGFLSSGEWVLLNSYINRSLSATPIMRMGKVDKARETAINYD